MSQPTNTVKVILEVIHEQQNNLACVLMTGRGKVWSKSVELFLLSCTISTFTILQILPSGGRSNVYHSLNRSAFFSAISSNSSSSRISFSVYMKGEQRPVKTLLVEQTASPTLYKEIQRQERVSFFYYRGQAHIQSTEQIINQKSNFAIFLSI